MRVLRGTVDRQPTAVDGTGRTVDGPADGSSIDRRSIPTVARRWTEWCTTITRGAADKGQDLHSGALLSTDSGRLSTTEGPERVLSGLLSRLGAAVAFTP